MKDRTRLLILLVVVGMIAGVFVARFAWPAAGRTPGREGEGIATSPGAAGQVPRWLFFHSQACSPCREMEKTFRLLREEFAGQVEFVAIEVNDPANRALVQTYGIRYVPTSYLLDRHGKLFYEKVGLAPAGEMRAKLKALVEMP